MNKNLSLPILFFFLVHFLTPPLYAQIPESRITDWQNAGVTGGIPSGWQEIQAGSYGIVADGKTDNTTAINNLLNSSASLNKVIKFPAGTIRCNGKLEIPLTGNRIIRGTLSSTGQKLTRFVFNTGHIGANRGNFNLTGGSYDSDEINVISGYTKGSWQLNVASSAGLSAGDYIELRQDNDGGLIKSYRNLNVNESWAIRNTGQIFKIKSISGTTLSLTEAVRLTYKAGLNPKIQKIEATEKVGFEDFYSENLQTGNKNFFYFEMTANCWVKNVHTYKTVSSHVNIVKSLHLTIRDSFFDHSFSHDASDGYGISLGDRAGNCLIENNELSRLRHSFSVNRSANGNVFGYNNSHDGINIYNSSNPTVDVSLHGHFPYLNLFEGNSVEWIHSADHWGASGPGNTFFRNRVSRGNIDIDDYSIDHNVAGNEIAQNFKTVWEHSTVKNSFIHGNIIDGVPLWLPGAGSDNIRNSYYLSNKPSFLKSDKRWPLYGPVPAATSTAGNLRRDVWTNISGTEVTAIPLSKAPNSSTLIQNFEAPANAGDNFGARISGLLSVPVTGSYTFWISGDDKAELWLSASSDPVNKKKIAAVTSPTAFREWDKESEQKSVAIQLEAGRKYYMEAIHKESSGGDHVSVGWLMEDGTLQRPMLSKWFAPVPEENQTGGLKRELWSNVTGYFVSDIPVSRTPTSTMTLLNFEGPSVAGDNYGDRISGLITAPATGKYTFWIAGDDRAELWLSTSSDPAQKRKIAEVTAWTSFRQWDKHTGQKSVAIQLDGGKQYYIETLHKESAGGDHVSVGWQLSDGTLERPIPGNRFSGSTTAPLPPAEEPQEENEPGGETGGGGTTAGRIKRELWSGVSGNFVSDIPTGSTPGSITYPDNFEGPSTAGDNYGDRMSGLITAPATGNYTFWIAGDDRAELWLSSSADPAQKRKIAVVPSWTSYRQWTKYSGQKSAAIFLEAGKQYYIETLHKEGAGGDHISVGWQLADGTLERPIPGNRFSGTTTTPAEDTPDEEGETGEVISSGKIKRELWANVTGNFVSAIPLGKSPGSTSYLENFEGPSSAGDNYGDRISGHITPPSTGNYTFWIAGDDRAELWLSTSSDPAQKRKIAVVPSWTSYRQWDKHTEQKSVAIYLQAGKQYYIETLHKEGAGGDHISVGWQLTDGTLERPIPGKRFLAPATATQARRESGDKNDLEGFATESSQLYPNPAEDKIYIELRGFEGEEVQWSIFNTHGIKYLEGKTGLNHDHYQPLEIDLQQRKMGPGLYMIKIQSGDKEQVIKFIRIT